MRPVTTYSVAPNIPEALKRLPELAYNIRWSWDRDTIALFQRMDSDLWESTYHNPVKMLGMIDQDRMNDLAGDDGFLAFYDRVLQDFDRYMANGSAWYPNTFPPEAQPQIAYFSFEFGLTESIPNYSGGLGVLAGDHLKAASDLNVPLVGVGLLYQQGYFRQYLNADGWQQERYPINDFYTMPLTLMRDDSGQPLTISVDLAGTEAYAQIWRVDVGRIDLYLLDTNIPLNTDLINHELTDQLYGGDRETRIRQEILLGIGGLRALNALGIEPAVCHMNEGHAAFLSLERARILMERNGTSFNEAFAIRSASNVFTTHTPVPAGNDYFAPDLVKAYFKSYWESLGLTEKAFFALGRFDPDNDEEYLCMTVLALRASAHCNGVSRLHGEVARMMWKDVYGDLPVREIPIGSITNGVHTFSWLSSEMTQLFDRYLGPRWREAPADPAVWERTSQIPDEELWRIHERRRSRLVSFARSQLVRQLEARGAPPFAIDQAHEALDPEVLTIGFARRFATYKRATLLFSDPDRLLRMLHSEHPVQFVFAGKAHPHDNAGKEFIRQIVHFVNEYDCRDRIAFLEDYDMVIGRYLTQGVDVWLNTPRRPNEASGTSGMKAAMNGILNLSILDGWWAEAYQSQVGWAIGSGEVYGDNEAAQDTIEANAVYELLENDLIPTYYTRGADDLPRGWITRMKATIQELSPVFNTARMVQDYTQMYYYPALEHARRLSAGDYQLGREFAAWLTGLRSNWEKLVIRDVQTSFGSELIAGDMLQVTAEVFLGEVKPDHVAVQLFEGVLNVNGEIEEGRAHEMHPLEQGGKGKGWMRYSGEYAATSTGRHGCTVRIVPRHHLMGPMVRFGLVTWAS